MRWLLAGLTFAALVALAVGTAAVRAENAIRRHRCAKGYATVRDHVVEQHRLEADLLGVQASYRLARLHWQFVQQEAARRQGRLQ